MEEQVFVPANALTFETVHKDSQSLLKLFRDGEINEICFDLSQVKQCDSAGLALLIEAKRLAKQYNKRLIISKMPESISALAEFCGVNVMLKD